MNELSILAKYIGHCLNTSPGWTDNFPATKFFEEQIPTKTDITTIPAVMFVTIHTDDIKGNFGNRLATKGLYQIKAVTTGDDYSILELLANQIDLAFDWQNQIDFDAGRPKSQDYFVNPDIPSQAIRIMGMTRERPVKFPTFLDGVNHIHLGGEYEIECYKETIID